MNKLIFYSIAACVLGGVLLIPVQGQQQTVSPELQQLVVSLQNQSAAIKAGQDTLEKKMALLEEELRLIRIFSSRSGRGGGAAQ